MSPNAGAQGAAQMWHHVIVMTMHRFGMATHHQLLSRSTIIAYSTVSHDNHMLATWCELSPAYIISLNHACTHARTHARTHTHTHHLCSWPFSYKVSGQHFIQTSNYIHVHVHVHTLTLIAAMWSGVSPRIFLRITLVWWEDGAVEGDWIPAKCVNFHHTS